VSSAGLDAEVLGFFQKPASPPFELDEMEFDAVR
jgi:hypothetical protein